MKLLLDLARGANKSILIATHELDLALQMADLIWLAGKNKNIINGIPEDLVLNGTFDEIFELKGFDLKTGKVKHDSHTGKKIKLVGEGHEFLWTRNALERNGFEVADEDFQHIIIIEKRGGITEWKTGSSNTFQSLATLLAHLENR
jgi:iron complex transport system ATP-binding protein